jgi:hypothetical protein
VTTNVDGTYVATVPLTGRFRVSVDGMGIGLAHVNGKEYRGDLFVDQGKCIARYGIVIDRRTLRPIRRARLSLGSGVLTDADGWYRVDMGALGQFPPETQPFWL